MKNKVTIAWSLFNILLLGIQPLWYWQAESIGMDGKIIKRGTYIYGVQIQNIRIFINIWIWNI